MTASAVNRLIGQISRSVASERFGELPDAELLKRINAGDAVALEAVVRRHGGMVLAAASAVLTDEADIDDAFQAAFLALWRGGQRIRKGASLGPWLFGVARRAALKALSRSRRRRQIESASARLRENGDLDASWREVCRILYEEIERLPKQYRGPIVQCYLEGRSRDEAADDLGWKLATLRGRLERGREMLKRRLTRRGVVLSVGCVAWLVDDASAPAHDLPVGLIANTVRIISLSPDRLPSGVVELLPIRGLSSLRNVILATGILLAAGLASAGLGKKQSEDKPEPAPARTSLVALFPEDKPAGPPVEAALGGVWIFDSAFMGKGSRLEMVWGSKLTVASESFVLSRFCNLAKDFKGTFTIDPSADPKRIDLKIDAFDLYEIGMPIKIPPGTLPGIYKLEGDRLTVCFSDKPGGERPANFDLSERKNCRVVLTRTKAGFKDFPKEVTVRVLGPDGRPAPGAIVAGFMSRMRDRKKKDANPEWTYSESRKTGSDGSLKLPFEDMPTERLVVRDPDKKLIAFVGISPASVVNSNVTVKLAAERRIEGRIVCDELEKAGKPMEFAAAYLLHNDQTVAYSENWQGRFEFVAPPGSYVIQAYGEDFRTNNVPITVPAGDAPLVMDAIHLKALPLLLMQGKPAPEPKGVVGWKGQAVKLADMKGKYVILDFWGWWCGPCVGEMPMLIELHEKFADKGLAIIGIHLDVDGEIDTAAKLDEKLTKFKKEFWHGKDIPFPVALVPGKQVGEGDDKYGSEPSRQYGVSGYPTTILIDRDGNVVGRFGARDIKDATAQIEKLLAEKK